MLICDHWFHAVLLRQSSGRERKIVKKSKNTVKRTFTLQLCITLFICVRVCVYVRVDYICVLLYAVYM